MLVGFKTMKNKIDIIKFAKENVLITVVTAIVAVFLIIYLIIFAPLLKKIGSKYMECKALECQLAEGRTLISSAAGLEKKVGGRVLMSEKDAATAIDNFAKHGKTLGIDIISIKPKDVIAKEGTPYKILPVEMKIESNDKQFVQFIGSLDELNKALVRVRSFEIVPKADDRTKLNVDLTLDVYLSAKDMDETL